MKPTNYRWFVAILLCFVSVVNYMDRSVLAVALPVLGVEFHFTAGQLGLLSSAFLLTYAVMQIPMGAILDRIGERRMYITAVGAWSAITALTAVASTFGQFYVFRLLLGVFEAPVFPTGVKTVSEWFPRRERGKAMGIFGAGINLGALIALPLVAWLITIYGWKIAFIVVGSLGFLWLVFWIPAYHSRKTNKFANAAEIELIEGDLESSEDQPKMPWGQLLKRRSTLGILGGFFCQTYVLFVFQTWLPAYLVQGRGMTLMKAGILGVLPFMAGALGSLAGGATSDYLMKYTPMGRKYCMSFGLILGMAVIPAAFVATHLAAVLCISLSAFGIMFSNGAMMAALSEIAPVGQVGSLTSLVNTGGFVGGFLAPTITGYIVQATSSFVTALVFTGTLAFIGALIYFVFVPATRGLKTVQLPKAESV